MTDYRGPHGMSPYGPSAYGVGPYARAPYPMPREHPEGTVVLVLGLLSLVCGPLGFVAWYLGSKAERDIELSGLEYCNAGNIRAGKIVGMVTSILTMAGFALMIGYILLLLGFLGSMLSGMPG